MSEFDFILQVFGGSERSCVNFPPNEKVSGRKDDSGLCLRPLELLLPWKRGGRCQLWFLLKVMS